MPEIFNPSDNSPALSAPPTLPPSVPTVKQKLQSHTEITFEKQDPDEDILLVLRKHPVTNISWLVITLFFLLTPLFAGYFISMEDHLSFIPARFIPVMLCAYYITVFLYAITRYISWLYNIFIITQKRIVDVDFSDVIFHDVAITKVEEVEDVHYTQGGFLSSIFNYGNVFVQTQADKANFEAYSVPNPAEVARIIVSLTGKGGKDD